SDKLDQKMLKDLPTTLEYLKLFRCNLTDKMLAALAHLEHLRALDISLNEITGSTLDTLPRNLEYLNCDGNSELTDEGVSKLSCLSNLRMVSLDDCERLKGSSFRSLPQFLRSLGARNCRLSNEAKDLIKNYRPIVASKSRESFIFS